MGFIEEAIRVLQLTRKPRRDEFLLIAKITGLGMVLIGVIGVVVIFIARFIGLG